ncbi:MAG TPA: hypothetical protein VGG29_13325 [Caulobacteraceae bacterium]|jgi:hypothetical protein
MRPRTFLGGALALAITTQAQGQALCPSVGQRPMIFGQLVFQVVYPPDPGGADANPSDVFYLDFQSGDPPSLVKAPLPSGMMDALNPVFSPDGAAMVFTAVANNRHDIFYWPIGSSAAPINLTGASPSPNEDARFSRDGSEMVWKSDCNLFVAPFSYDSSHQPVLGASTQIVTGSCGQTSEASAPTFSPSAGSANPTAGSVFYFLGSTGPSGAAPEKIAAYSFSSRTSAAPFAQSAQNYYYFPVVGSTSSRLFYVSGGGSDKIFTYANADAISGSATAFAAADVNSDDSDPTPVDDDLFVFSRDHNVGGNASYELYLGQPSTNQCWSLTSWVSFPNGDNVLGATYAPVATTPWSLNGPNYHPGNAASAPGSAGGARWWW